MVGILLSFWDDLFAEAMLVSERVVHDTSQIKHQCRCFCGFFGRGWEGGKQLGSPSFDMEALVMAFGDLLDDPRSTRQTVANRRGNRGKTLQVKVVGE